MCWCIEYIGGIVDNWQKLEVVSKVAAAVLVPWAIAYLANNVSLINKQRDVEVKFVELATVILNSKPTGQQNADSDDSKSLRKWAVDVINKFSGVPMSAEAEKAVIERQALPLPSAIQLRPDATDIDVTWGVIFGGDATLNAANHEIKVTAKLMGISDATIFRRSGSFRSVKTYVNRMEADAALEKAKSIRESSYLVNMAKWCPTSIPREGYFECSGP